MKIKKIQQAIGLAGTISEDITTDSFNAVPTCRTVREQSAIYSETETRIGTWIDGKPTYRRVVDFGSAPNSEYKTILHNINVDTPIKCSAILYNASTGAKFTAPWVNVDITFDKTNISVQTSSDRSAWTVKFILEYTKTTN